MKKTFSLYLIISVVLLSVALGTNCRKRYATDCEPSSSCNQIPIDSGDVTIKLTYSNGNAGVPVILYKGNIEDNEILWADTVYTNQITFYLPNRERYSAEAYYQVGNQKIIALDGKKLKQNSTNDCGAKCYTESSISLDVEL